MAKLLSDDDIFSAGSPPSLLSDSDVFGAGPAPATRNPFWVANDMVIEAANAFASGAGAVADFFSPGNRFSKAVDDFVKSGEAAQSDVVKASKDEFQNELTEAQTVGDEVLAVGKYLVRNPLLAVSQAAGSFAGPGLAVKGAQGTAAIAGLGAKGAGRAGLGAGAATGATMAGGDAAGTAYELVNQISEQTLSKSPQWQELAAEGMSPAEIREELAQRAAKDARLIPALIGGIGGTFGAEKLLAGLGRSTGSALARGAKGAAAEGLQEALEEGVTAYEGRRAASELDPTIDPTKGVAAAATMGGALGGVTGGGVGMLTPASPARPATPQEQAQKIFEAQDIDTAIAAAVELATANKQLAGAVDEYLGAPVQPAVDAESPAAGLPGAPAAPPRQTVAQNPEGARARVDRDAELTESVRTAMTQRDRQSALEQRQMATGQPQPGAAAGYADLTPMNPRQAQQRLAVLRDQVAREGGNALELQIVSHPRQRGKLAIGRRGSELPSLELGTSPAAPKPVDSETAQQRIESAALAGKEQQRRQTPDEVARQGLIDRVMQAIERRGGVASPYEAQVLREANMGQPYDRVDPGLATPLREEEALTAATGIAVGRAPREEVVTPEKEQRLQAEAAAEAAAQKRRGKTPPSPLSAAPGTQRALFSTRRDEARADYTAWRDEQGLPDTVGTFAKYMRSRVQASAEATAAMAKTHNWKYNVGDQFLSTQTGQAYKITGRTFQKVVPRDADGKKAGEAKLAPVYFYETRDGGKGTFIESRLVESKTLKSLTTPRPSTERGESPPRGAPQTERPPSKIEGVSPDTLPRTAEKRGGRSTLTRDVYETIRQVARAYGKRVVLIRGTDNDGLFVPSDPDTIYLNVESSKPHLVVFGHELLHSLKADSPAVYKALQQAIEAQLKDGALSEFEQDYGQGADLEELVADIVGNRMLEESFWSGVFGQMDRPVVIRLGQAVINAVNKAKKVMADVAGFRTDAVVKDLDAVRSAVQGAMREYAQQQRRGAASTTLPVSQTRESSSEKRTQTSDEQPRDAEGKFKGWDEQDELAAAEAQLRASKPRQDGVTIREVPGGFDALDAAGKKIGYLRDNLERGQAAQLDENANIDIVKVDKEVKGQGVGARLYKAFFAKHGGRVAPSGKTTADAWAVWKRYYPEKVEDFVQQEAARLRSGADQRLVIGNITDPAIAQRVLAAANARYSTRRTSEDLKFQARAQQLAGEKPAPKRSAVALMRGEEKPPLLPTNFDISRYFTMKNRAGMAEWPSARAQNAVLDSLYADTLQALSQDGSAVGWYDRKVKVALDLVAQIHPEIATDEQAKFGFVVMTAITSNSTKVNENFEKAEALYRRWKETGEWPTTVPGAKAADAMKQGLEKIGALVQQHGWEKVRDFMTADQTIADIEAFSGVTVQSELADEKVYGAVFLGSKVGAFFNNLYGNFTPVTMDRWFMRTINRTRGNMLELPASFSSNLERLKTQLAAGADAYGFDVDKINSEIDAWLARPAEEQQDVLKALRALKETAGYVAERNRIYSRGQNGRSYFPRTSENLTAKLLHEGLTLDVQTPAGGGERRLLRGIMRRLQDRLKSNGIPIEMADLQAVLWYYEKDLFALLKGQRSQGELFDAAQEPEDYETAARRLLARTERPGAERAGSVRSGQRRQQQAGRTEDLFGEAKASPGRLDAVEAYHYSGQPRKQLSTGFYGTGLRGSGRQDYLEAEDARRRKRLYFYVDKGTGVRPESGVGGIPHKVSLDNIYDVNADPLKLRKGSQAATETAILDAGFAGYLDRLMGTQPGQVILLGDQTVNAEPLPVGTRVQAEQTYPLKEGMRASAPRSATLDDFKRDKLEDILKLDNWAILTAEDPGAKKQSAKKNAADMEDLEADLKARGFGYTKAIGKYGDVQNAFIVTGISEAQALELGKKYGQESVLTRNGLVYSDGRPNTPPTGKVTVYDTPPEDFYTAVPSASAYFQVELNFDSIPEVTEARASKKRDEKTQRLVDLRKEEAMLNKLLGCLSK